MAALDVNKLLPFIAGSLVLGAAAVVYSFSGNDDAGLTVQSDGGIDPPVITEVDADNTTDTIRALSGHVTHVREEMAEVTEKNNALTRENAEIVAQRDEKVEALSKDMTRQLNERDKVNAEAQNALMTQLKHMQSQMALMTKRANAKAVNTPPSLTSGLNGLSDATEIVPGFGLGLGLTESGSIVSGHEMVDLIWVDPLDRSSSTDAETGLAGGAFGSLANPFPKAENFRGKPLKVSYNTGSSDRGEFGIFDADLSDSVTKPYFTLPDLSAMTDAVALTSLVGKVFLDEIKDPWPFKIMIGRDNLTANYHDLPIEIDGMLFEGYAVGDWTLSCVRGWVTAATFVFEDGTTVSAYAETDGARPKDSRFSESAIGYISDPVGNPCIKGVRATDAPRFLASRFTAAALSGYGEALTAENEQRNTSVATDGTINTITTVLDANSRYATNSAFSRAFDEGAQWIRERQKQSFDAIYAPPGQKVVMNLQAELRLDKKPHARKLRYAEEEYSDDELD